MRFATLAIVIIVALGAIAAALHVSSQKEFPELTELSARSDWEFNELVPYFKKLAEEKGAAYAFDILLHADLPRTINTHLVAHEIGYVLYDQEGMQGIQTCTQDFRNACSHSVVISALIENGEGSLSQIAEICRQAPGGKGAYTMCFHGLGHGVLAYTDYNLEQAVAMCQETATSEYQGRESIECIGGTVMEMIDGYHDPEAWELQKSRYLTATDPLSPCNASFMPEEARGMCYAYLTPHFFSLAGTHINVEDMSGADFTEAFSFCAPLSNNPELSDACYQGFGKEFVTLAAGRNARDIGSIPASELSKVWEWCSQAPDGRGKQVCAMHALAFLFWGGENKPDASFSFCELVEGSEQEACYQELAGQISYYQGGTLEGLTLCDRLPSAYQALCGGSASYRSYFK